MLAAPDSGLYDAVLLQISVVFWLLAWSASRRPWMWSFAFAVWLLPALGPPLLFGVSRAGPLVTVALILVLLLGADAYPGRAGDRESTQGIEPYASTASG